MLVAAALLWVALVVALRVLSAGGAWHVGWLGAVGLATVLWPLLFAGYACLSSGFRSEAEAVGGPVAAFFDRLDGFLALAVGFLWSLLVLGLASFMEAFESPARGGFLNFVISVVALHLMTWSMVAAARWAWAAWRSRLA